MLLNMLTVWLILINLVGFIQMYVDKQRARKDKWRIPEKQLFFFIYVYNAVNFFYVPLPQISKSRLLKTLRKYD